jgi:hypothetical protein
LTIAPVRPIEPRRTITGTSEGSKIPALCFAV